MRICVHVDGNEGVGWDLWQAMAKECEAVGLEGLYSSDHYGGTLSPSLDSLDAWTVMAGLAAVTSTLRLGLLMTAGTFRHPSVLARVTNAVDHISGGRVDVALGAGWLRREHRRNGFAFPPTPDRFQMLEEQVEILLRSWSGEVFDFAGSCYQLEGQCVQPLPVQLPHPPLIIGGEARTRSAALAARYADEYNHPMTSVADLKAAKTRLDAACEKAGRDPATLKHSVFLNALVGTDEADLRRRLTAAGRHQPTLTSAQPDELLANPPSGWVIGTVVSVSETLAEYEAVGVSRTFLKLVDHDDLSALSLFAEVGRRRPA